MAWLVPKNLLDDQQLNFVNNIDINKKNVWIKGFPGSGKSVLLAYTLQKIKRSAPDASVVVVVFTHSLINMYEAAFQEINEHVNVMTYLKFVNRSHSYDYILVDEVQDLPESVLVDIKSRGKHVIVAGDENQSIYEKAPNTDEPTVDPIRIPSLLDSDDYTLNIIHRLSNSIISVVHKFLPKMNIFKAKVAANKIDTEVRLCKAKSSEEEVKYIYQESLEAVNEGYSACVLLPSHNMIKNFVMLLLSESGNDGFEVEEGAKKLDYYKLNAYFIEKGLSFQYVGNGVGAFDENKHVVYIMTYHSSKGIDFDNVFIPFMNTSWFLFAESEERKKVIFMVAMTRSRGNLYLLYHGIPHRYVGEFTEKCHDIDVHEQLSGGNTFSSSINNSGTDNDFGI